MKRFLSLVLVALLLVGCLWSTALAADTQTAPFTYYTRTNANKESAPDNEIVLAEIEKRSGIQLSVVPISNESYGETISMKVAAGDAFDSFNLVGAAGINYKDLVTKDAIIPLNSLIDQYGPHIKEVMSDAFEYIGTDAEGNIWTLPRCEAFTMGFVPTIRQDWLDKLNMEMPKTIPELEAYFDAVLANDMNENGDTTDEIPYLGDGFLYGMSNFSCYFLGNACTGFDSNRRYLDEDGVVRSIYEHPNFKLLLETFARWYAKGYMAPEANMLTTTQRADLRNADRVGMTAGWYTSGVSAELTIRENGNPDATYVALNPLEDTPEGGIVAWPANPPYDNQTVVMKNAENGEWLVKYYDWMLASSENLALAAYGIEGKHWEWVDKETNVIKLLPDSANYSGYYMLGNLYFYPLLPTLQVDPSAAKDYEYCQLQDQIRNHFNMVPAFDAIITYDYTYTDAEFLSNDGYTAIEEAITKIVLGQMDISQWDSVIATYKATEGDIYSKVWTEQYHQAAGK